MIARGDGDGEVSGLGALRELIAELEVRRAQAQDGAGQDALAGLFREQEREVPAAVTPSSFLYLRTLPIDLGDRPLGPGRHWHSPDLTLTPAGRGLPPTTDLVAGETYVISCTLRNRGDLRVPRAQVELFLTDPTLGFDTRRAVSLTGGVPLVASVPAFGEATVRMSYAVPREEAGHKCLFARAYSFLPQELPVDPYRLDPRMDRRIAQQNLMIAAAGQTFSFHVVHAPLSEMTLRLRPLDVEEVGSLPELAGRDLRPFDGREVALESIFEQIEIVDSDAAGIDVSRKAEALFIRSEGEGASPGARWEIEAEMRGAIERLAQGRISNGEFSTVKARYRRLRAQAVATRLAFQVPNVGIGRGGIAMFELTAEEIEGEAFGGILLGLAG